MNFDVIPRNGVGVMRFGMLTNEIREAMKLPFESFYKSADSVFPTDSFLEDALHVFYRQPGVCEAIEMYSPSRAILQGVDLLNKSYEEVRLFLKGLDSQLEEDIFGLTSKKLGIGIYAPLHVELPDSPTESVIVFEDGYYDR